MILGFLLLTYAYLFDLVVYILLEATHRYEEEGVKDIWSIIRRTYETHSELRTADHRQDVTVAARITASAWLKYATHMHKQDPTRHDETPGWVASLCQTFNLPQPNHWLSTADAPVCSDAHDPLAIDFDLDMIDWSTWDRAYLNGGLFN